ncbi:MAG: hypothetical protein U0800_28050 [Isosphaeraceae bacterium]
MSSQRTRGGSAASRGRAAARPAAGGRGIYVSKPKNDIYVALLGVALGSLLLGCLFLALYMGKHDFKIKAAALPAALQATV